MINKFFKIFITAIFCVFILTIKLAAQEALPASYFKYELTKDGYGIKITDTTAPKGKLIFPDFIEGLPVTEINMPTIGLQYNQDAKEYTYIKFPKYLNKLSSLMEGKAGYPNRRDDAAYKRNRLRNSVHNLSEIVFPDGLLNYGIGEFRSDGSCYVYPEVSYFPRDGNHPFYYGVGQNIKIYFGKEQIITGLWRSVKIDSLDIPCLIVSHYAFAYGEAWPYGGWYSDPFAVCKVPLGYIKKVNIESQVIGEGAFINQEKLESVTLGKDINIICKDAFRGCRNLKELIIPDEVKAINFSDSATIIFKENIPSKVDKILNAVKSKLGIGNSVNEKKWITYTSESSKNNNAFEGCSSLPIKTQQRLRELGYKGPF